MLGYFLDNSRNIGNYNRHDRGWDAVIEETHEASSIWHQKGQTVFDTTKLSYFGHQTLTLRGIRLYLYTCIEKLQLQIISRAPIDPFSKANNHKSIRKSLQFVLPNARSSRYTYSVRRMHPFPLHKLPQAIKKAPLSALLALLAVGSSPAEPSSRSISIFDDPLHPLNTSRVGYFLFSLKFAPSQGMPREQKERTIEEKMCTTDYRRSDKHRVHGLGAKDTMERSKCRVESPPTRTRPTTVYVHPLRSNFFQSLCLASTSETELSVLSRRACLTIASRGFLALLPSRKEPQKELEERHSRWRVGSAPEGIKILPATNDQRR